MSTASTAYLKPAVSVLIGCTLLGESFTWMLAIGLLAIFFGIAAINDRITAPRLIDVFRHGKDGLLRRAPRRLSKVAANGGSRAKLGHS
jgi:hypothetical protein